MARIESAPSFRGLWIDKPILLDPELSCIEKIIVAEVYQLQKDERGCFAGNGKFCAITGVKERSIRKHLTALEEKGYLRTENRSSRRRRMWVSDKLAQSIRASEDLSRIPTRSLNAASAVKPGIPDQQTRKQAADKPGTGALENEALLNRQTRHGIATENTVREQNKKTDQNTGETSGANFVFPEGLPASDWENWITYNAECGRKLTPSQMRAQADELIRLRSKGNPPGLVIDQAIQNGWKSFHELPAEKRPKRGFHTTGSIFL